MIDLSLYRFSLATLRPPGRVTADFRPAPLRRPSSIRRIQAATAEHYDIPVYEMTSHRRSREVSHPRQVAMFLARELTPRSLPDIGRYFGGRDHTTVMHAIASVTERMAINEDVAEDIQTLRARLG